jgi:hypothetical protein
MKLRLKALTIATLVLGFLLAGAATAYATGTIQGTVRDSYLSNPVNGVLVTVVEAANADSLVATTSTATDGTYRFTGLAESSYYLYFSDPALRYWPQWYDWVDTFADATSIDTTASSVFVADVRVDGVHVKLRSRLDTAAVSADSSATPFLGQAVTLETTATDALWGDPLTGMRVYLQSSADRSTWTTVGPADGSNYDGTYRSTFTATSVAVRYYRFSIGDASDSVATASPDVRIAPKVPATSWQGATLEGTATTDIVAAASQPVTIRGRLLDHAGVPMIGANVVLELSADGVNWTTGPAASAVTTVAGEYHATVRAGDWTFYRFAFRSTGYDLSSVSGRVMIRAPWAIRVTAPRHVKPGKRFFIEGRLNPGSPRAIQVRVSVQRLVGKTWRGYRTYVGIGKKQGNNTFFNVRPTLPKGEYRFRVSAPADIYRLAAINDYQRIAVW